jgi:hypothetical protein
LNVIEKVNPLGEGAVEASGLMPITGRLFYVKKVEKISPGV